MELLMKDISKSFGSNLVLDGVDFTLSGGEIKALLGENGAGKSTLMNILGGVLEANGGTISLDGQPVRFTNPRDSLEAGIAFIHQELNLINDLAIYENLFDRGHGLRLRAHGPQARPEDYGPRPGRFVQADCRDQPRHADERASGHNGRAYD